MNVGENIARYRKEKGLKQSELGEHIGVSAQAVSKWENGGAPDVTLLPKIAQALDISVGMLFGESGGDWKKQALAELIGDDPEAAVEKVCGFLWELQKGISEPLGFSDVIKDVGFVNTPLGQANVRICQDSGIWLANIHQDFHYSLVMPEPADGFASVLAAPEEYEKIFSVLGRKNRCRVLLWLYGQKRPVSLHKIETQLHIPARDALEDLVDLGFAQKLEVELEEGVSVVYGPLSNYSQLPFLYFLQSFLHEQDMNIISYDMRKKPLLD